MKLNKYAYIIGLECKKGAWTTARDSTFTKKRILELSRAIFPDKKVLIRENIISDATETLIDMRIPYEGGSDIYLVKESKTIKEKYIEELAFQKYHCESAGIKVRNAFIAYINKDYSYNGVIQADKLFIIKDATEELSELSLFMKEKVESILKEVNKEREPKRYMGPHCKYCTAKTECWSDVAKGSVLELMNGGKRAFGLYQKNIKMITDLSDNDMLSYAQRIQKQSVECQKPFINKKAITDFFENIEEPFTYLDSEGFGPSVPLFDKTSPFQQIPAIFCAIGKKEIRFSPIDINDPRKEFLNKLKEIPIDGTIFCFGAFFEKTRLKELGNFFPEDKEFLSNLTERIVDLEEIFKKIWFYHPEQRGKTGLKEIYSAIFSESYTSLDGYDAQKELISFFEGNTKEIGHILEYCSQDAKAVKRIHEYILSKVLKLKE
jgi:hypothetical protein